MEYRINRGRLDSQTVELLNNNATDGMLKPREEYDTSVLAVDEKTIGHIAITGVLGEFTEIGAQVVHPEYRGKGIGYTMLDKIMGEVETESVILFKPARSVALEERGFKVVSPEEIPKWFSDLCETCSGSCNCHTIYKKDLGGR